MANSYPASGQVILDDLKVCTSARLQPHFVSYGEHMFMNLESAHSNSYLPVVTFSRAGCTLGAIGLERASNSDSLGSYSESEMIIGTRANTPTSIQTNGVRRINITNDGRIGIGSTNFTLGGFNAKMLIKQTSNGDWTGLQISDAADENVINFGYNGTDFLISQSWRQGGGPIKNLKIGLGCQLFLRNDGNVGIGTTGPSTKLHIINKIDRAYTSNSFNDTSHALHIDFCNQNQRAGLIRWTSHGNLENSFGVVQVGCAAAGCGQGDFVFQAYREAGGASYSELMRLTNTGNVGIGCTTPSNTLEVNGTGRFAGTVNIGTSASSTSRFQLNFQNWNASNSYPYITFQNPAANCRHGIGINTSDNFVIGRATGVDCNFAHQDFVIVNSTGNVGINTTSPGSYRLNVNGSFYSAGSSCEYKQSICQYNTDSCMFMKLKPVTYQYKDEWCHLGKELKSGTQIGLIAEDTAEVFPELAILKDEDEQKVVRNVDYEKLSIILLSEVQKLRKEVDNLKNNK